MDTQTPTQATPPREQAPQSPGRQAGVVVAGLVGWAEGGYCGWQWIIPLAIAFGVGWLLKRIPGSPATFRFAWALVAAQALYLVADIVMGGAWLPDGLVILVMAAGLAWLWVRPGIGPMIYLGLYQVATTVLIVVVYGRAQFGSWQQKALVSHICLNAAVVVLLISGYVKLRKGLDGRS